VDEATWEVAHPRVMVLLKEANSADDGWKYQDLIRNKGYLKERTTWPTLVRWIYGLLHRYPTFADVEKNWAAIREQSQDFFKGIYFANVKEIPGGSSAIEQIVLDFAKKHTDFLVRQVDIVEHHSPRVDQEVSLGALTIKWHVEGLSQRAPIVWLGGQSRSERLARRLPRAGGDKHTRQPEGQTPRKGVSLRAR